MTPSVEAALPPVASCLRGGGIAVLFVPVDGGVVAARDAVRALCSEVLAALAVAHRLLPHASRSATPGLGALALSGSAGVGVDVERLRPELVDSDLLALALHVDERGAGHDGSFFDRWTRKEAVMKALGVGLALAPASFHAGPPTAGWHALQTRCGAASVRSLEHPCADGFAAALATAGDAGAPAGVRTFWLHARPASRRLPVSRPRMSSGPAGSVANEPAHR